MRKLFLLTLIALFITLTGYAQDTAAVENALKQLPGYTFGQERAAFEPLAQAVRKSALDEKLRSALETKLLNVLDANCTIDAKRFICRQLIIIGSDAAIPTLSNLLRHDDTINIACHVLEAIPGDASTNTLLDSLKTANDTQKLALIGTLGRKNATSAVAPVSKYLNAETLTVALAAADALGAIGTEKAMQVLKAALPQSKGALHAAIADACLRCCAQAVKQKNNAAAVSLYQELMQPNQLGHVRAAALSGLVQAQPEKALEQVLQALTESDKSLTLAAAGYVRRLPGEEATRAFASLLANATTTTQLLLIDALADRGDRLAGDAVSKAASSAHEEVRLAALTALAVLGDKEVVDLLLEAATTRTGQERRVAQDSLARLNDPTINGLLLARAEKGSVALRTEALEALAARKAVETRTALLGFYQDPEAEVREAALKALRVLAMEEDLQPLLRFLESPKAESDRSVIERTLVAVAKRIPDPIQQTEAIRSAYAMTADTNYETALLRVLGELHTQESLAILAQALQNKDADLRLVALEKLGAWSNETPLDVVRTVLLNPASDDERNRALSAYLKLLRGAENTSQRELIARYQEVFTLLNNSDELKTALAGVANLVSTDALKMAQGYLTDDTVSAEATFAMLRIAKNLSGIAPKEVIPAIQPFLSNANPAISKQAKAIQEAIEAFDGYLAAWQYAGPYFEEGKSGKILFDDTFPPETEPEKILWKSMPMAVDERPWVIALAKVLGGEHRVVFLRTYVHSDKRQPAVLELGTNDGVKTWWNGELIHEFNEGRPLTPGQDQLALTLNKGWNTLVLAVFQHGGNWEACARLRTPDGEPLEGVTSNFEMN